MALCLRPKKSKFNFVALKETLYYFAFFKYAPTVLELWTFYPQKIDFNEFASAVKNLADRDKLIIKKEKVVLPENKLLLQLTAKKALFSREKIAKRKLILQALGLLPQVKFIGISGSVAVNNAQEKDDIDIFVITKKKRLWLARFLLIVITSVLGIRREPKAKSYKNKLCFNLFFSEENLQIDKHKQTEYVAHEILQLKPVINKNKTYERFLLCNDWIFKFFPNAKERLKLSSQSGVVEDKKQSWLGNLLEALLKKVQLQLINRHKTKEVITDTQLWFFPEDFEKKLRV